MFVLIDQKKTLLRQAEKNVEEMNSMISEMEFELNKFGPNSRMSVSNKIKQFKLDVELVQKDIVTHFSVSHSERLDISIDIM